jgi:hypothetical protein
MENRRHPLTIEKIRPWDTRFITPDELAVAKEAAKRGGPTVRYLKGEIGEPLRVVIGNGPPLMVEGAA